MIGPAAVFLLFSFLLLYTSPGGWRGRAKPISSTRHPGRSGVTFHLISNNVIINIFSFHLISRGKCLKGQHNLSRRFVRQ